MLKNTCRSNTIAIRAFNVEVSRVQDQISDPKIGLMRMKFWEDALDKCFSNGDKIPNHPVVLELYRVRHLFVTTTKNIHFFVLQVIRSNKLTKRHFSSLIKSRKDIMTSNSFPTLESMEKYADQSVSSVYYLILEGSDIRNVHADHAASHLGKAQGLCQLLRSVPLISRTNFIPLPQDLLAEFKISHEDVKRAKNNDKIKECVFKIASRANQHLEKARNLAKSVPKDANKILLPAVVTDTYLQRLLRVDCDIFHKNMQLRNLTWIPVVWWKNFKNTY